MPLIMDARSVAPAAPPHQSPVAAAFPISVAFGDRSSPIPFASYLSRTSSTSITGSVTGMHDFKVTGFSLLEGMGVGRFVSSSTFAVGGRDWAVRFYPDGATVDCGGNASAFLYYSGREAAGVRARFTLALLERDGKMSQATNSGMRHTFCPANDNWGFVKFVDKSRLLQHLDHDCLTIRCVLTVVKESRTVDGRGSNSIVVPPSNLHLDFEQMLNDGEGADVTFTVDDQLFSAHRCVLAYRSPVFKAELFGPMKENVSKSIPIDDMEPSIFEALLYFIYTDRLPDSCSDGKNPAMQHLLVAADRYGVERLRLMCESKLSEAIDVDTVATTLVLAEQHNCSQLRRACIGFMASPNMLSPVMRSDGFKHLMESCPLVMKEILDEVSRVWSDRQSGSQK
ncbi:hypothetical protein QOZ80_4BG0334120 [Eleusine coracana subsp. coracana]|nr:hypothetical protein QOZ80_4BG0334120 [Eleusine coracana subsp. coracana]